MKISRVSINELSRLFQEELSKVEHPFIEGGDDSLLFGDYRELLVLSTKALDAALTRASFDVVTE